MMQTVTREDEIAAGIARERAALYLRQRPVLRLGNVLLQMCVVLLLWSSQSHTWLVAWLALNLLLMGGRARATAVLARGNLRTAPDVQRWFRDLTYSVGLAGLLWGTGALLFLEADNPVHLGILQDSSGTGINSEISNSMF